MGTDMQGGMTVPEIIERYLDEPNVRRLERDFEFLLNTVRNPYGEIRAVVDRTYAFLDGDYSPRVAAGKKLFVITTQGEVARGRRALRCLEPPPFPGV